MDRNERDSGFRDRLAKVIGDQEPYPWAERLGIGKSTFAGPWIKGAIPQTKTLLKIAQNTDISLNWLLAGRGPERIGERDVTAAGRKTEAETEREEAETETASDAYANLYGSGTSGAGASDHGRQAGTPVEDMGERYRVPKEDYVLVPRYSMQVGEGPLLHSRQVVDHLSFKLEWIEQTMGLDSRQLALIHMRGDSMEPTLKEGDMLLLDRRGFSGTTQVNGDAIYVLLRGDILVAKRLQYGFDGSLTVQNDNPAYATQTLSEAQSAQLQVVGRVVWVGRRT